ncbi:MAG: hypothetical protein KKB59_19220, partial [Spirochaetes bacterium]|nr:hypothetical protein [Spirochaetota bacterium]
MEVDMYSGGTNDMEYRKSLKPLAKMAYGSNLTANDSARQEDAGCERWALTPFGPAKYRYGQNAAGCTRGELL